MSRIAEKAREALKLSGIARAAGLPQAVYEGLDAMEAELIEAQRIIRQQAAELATKATNEARLRQSRAELAAFALRRDETKQAASDARKDYEAAVAAHFELEAELDSLQPRLPFGPDSLPPSDGEETES